MKIHNPGFKELKMYLAKVIEGTIEKIGSIPEIFPNTSIDSASFTSEFLSKNNCMFVKEWIDHDIETEKLKFVDPYISGDFVFIVKVSKLNEGELQFRIIQKERSIREKRNELLAETDWMANTDVVMTEEWADYRQALRDITLQQGFPHEVVWPEKPTL